MSNKFTKFACVLIKFVHYVNNCDTLDVVGRYNETQIKVVNF